MTDIEQEIAALREQAARQGEKRVRADHEAAAARGRLEAAEAALAEEFKVDGIEAARALAGKLKDALSRETARVRELLAQAGGE